MPYILFLIGLVLLIVGGDSMVRGAIPLAQRMKVSALFIGVVLVGFGTSTPELVASLFAVLGEQRSDGLAIGNVIGSNIANVLLVLGCTAVLNPIKFPSTPFHRDALFLLLTVIALDAICYIGGLSRPLAIVFIVLLASYMWYTLATEKQESVEAPSLSFLKSLLLAVGGIAGTLFGAKMMVNNAVIIAQQWGVSDTIIGLSVIAIGTSLPELASSIMASLHKHNSMVIGNIVGSNIYNAFFILGVVAVVCPLRVPGDMTTSAFVMTGTMLLFILCGYRKVISRPMGLLFLVLYGVYLVSLAKLP